LAWVTLSQYEEMIGLKTHVRVDNSLYTDHETAAERTKREAKEVKAAAAVVKAAAGLGRYCPPLRRMSMNSSNATLCYTSRTVE
jgi:hypothetical protein